MKTIRFTAYPDGYKCSEPGDQSGEYVKAEEARMLVEHLIDTYTVILKDMEGKRKDTAR